METIVDSSDFVLESNEVNNTAAVKIDIQAKKKAGDEYSLIRK